MGKKQYNSKTIGTIWLNEAKKGPNKGELFTTVDLVSPVDEDGGENKYFKGQLFFQDDESGNLYKINKLKTFSNDNHDKILGNIAVELNDEEYSELVTGEDEEE